MKKQILAILGCLTLSYALYAQTGWLPPVDFTAYVPNERIV